RAVANAGELARRLAEHPGVSNVRYPGLPGDPGHQLAARQMAAFGAVLCLEVGADVAGTERFLDALRVWVPATSLGGVESLVERRRRYASEPASIPETMVRLSVGIEHVDDLWADLVQAIEAAQ
ncbi:MAG: PLP-dependent transferase, partial [Micropruina sp.]